MHARASTRCAVLIGILSLLPLTSGAFSSGATAEEPKGPFAPTWQSLQKNYKVPRWFQDGKFGIFIHWGLYSIPAHRSEWYAKHMYSDPETIKWHTEHYGPPDKFGYKDFVPLFKAEKYDPDQWATLFKKAGARYVVPVAEHHDGFAMYDSSLTRWNARSMGPKRDLIGELASSVRNQGLTFGLSYHRMEHHTFMYPTSKIKTDIFDPLYADFYGPPVPGHMDDGDASQAFQEDWLTRCQELVDKYHPQLVYFDNGVNQRAYDSVKLRFAAYFYNRARAWGKEVSINTKDAAYLAGNIRDYEKDVRGPNNFLPNLAPYQIDDVISDRSWGYVSDMKYRSAGSIINELVDTVSKNGNLMLNISPMGDGSIPEPQQKILLEIGQWLAINGEAIYGTRPWDRFGEGPSYEAQLAGANPHEAARKPPSGADYRFTAKGKVLYAITLAWPGKQALITSLAGRKSSSGKVKSVRLLGSKESLRFSQDQDGLKISLPGDSPGNYAYVFKIEGLKLD